MSKTFRIRDPVHGFVGLDADEVKIVGTRIFQRLRGIRQLALANLVYPGALHTRFDHSLGVCHVAGMMAEALGVDSDPQDRSISRLVRLAGLLHDLGHGPFSHVSEDALERYAKPSSVSSAAKKEKVHEVITCQLIRADRDLQAILGVEKCNRVADLLSDWSGEPAQRNIVSGPLDADKQDYLLRDSHFCGVPYGLFDLHQLHRSFVLGGPTDERELWIDADGVHAVEQYVLAKYYLTTMVYRHQVRLITDQMIARAIVLGVEHDGIDELRAIYAFDGSQEFLERYVTWDDAKFLMAFTAERFEGKLCHSMLQRLVTRNLLKQIFTARHQWFRDPATLDLLPKLGKIENDSLRGELERGIATMLEKEFGQKQEIDARFVIVFSFDIRSVRETSRDDERSIMVETFAGPRPFEEESALFASINEKYSDGYIEVYAPVHWENYTQRKGIREKLKQPIRELIEDRCRAWQNDGEGQ